MGLARLGGARRSTPTCPSTNSPSGNSPATCCRTPTHDQKIATAFNRNHLLNGEGGAIAEEQRNVVLFDRVDSPATTWLGLTMACAQCHDHKYDPITQRDYYSLMAAFNNVPESGVPTFIPPASAWARRCWNCPRPSMKRRWRNCSSRKQTPKTAAGPEWETRRDALQKAWEDELLADDKPAEVNWKRLIHDVREDPTDKPNKYAAGRVRTEFDDKPAPGIGRP